MAELSATAEWYQTVEKLLAAPDAPAALTELLDAVIRVQESEERFAKAFQASPDGMVISRLDDGTICDVNDAFCSMLGYTAAELCRTPWPQITHPQDVDVDLIPFRRMAAGELSSYTVEKRFIHKQGHPVWARLTLSLVRDAHGRPDYEIAIIEDIGARKRAEHARQPNENAVETWNHRTPERL